MKKSIRIAAALCAAVFLAGALAGCNSDDDEENGGGSGGKVENRFAGKTIEYENTDREEHEDGRWYEYYDYEKITFTKDTATSYSKWYSTSYYQEDAVVHTNEYEYTYVLESVNGKNVLHLTVKNPKYYLYDDKDEEKECTFDAYVSAKYNGISSTTKELLRKVESTGYIYYEFTNNNMVRLYHDYYVGDMTKSMVTFSNDYNSTSPDEYVHVYFAQEGLEFEYEKRDANGNWVEMNYWGIPQFNGKSFTAEMYRVDEIRDEQGSSRNRYTSVGKITGSYAINDTGSKCTGTVSFTKFPNDEMKNLFATSYQVQNYDSDGDGKDEEPDYTEYTIK